MNPLAFVWRCQLPHCPNVHHLKLSKSEKGIIPFSDQEHADAFAKAIQKAIVVCKSR